MTHQSDDRSALEDLRDDHSDRRRFLRAAGGGGVASALGALLAACGGGGSSSKSSSDTSAGQAPAKSSSPASGDVGIVNYALTLEHIEADFYAKVAASGVIKDAKTLSLAKAFGDEEQQHVDALSAAVKKLGGTPVKAPATNFDAVLDGGPMKVLTTAATVENLGAAAYLGQAPRIKSREILAAALSIHSVEARHAAALNKLIDAGFQGSSALSGSIPDGAFAKPMSMQQVLAAAKPFLA